MKELDFKIKDNYLTIGEDCFDINEILMGEIVKNKGFLPDYFIKLTFVDDFVDKWIVLDYNTYDEIEIFNNFKQLFKGIKSANHNYMMYKHKYFVNLNRVDNVEIDKTGLSKFVMLKSGRKNYKLKYSKNEYNLLLENLNNLDNNHKGI